MAKTKPGKVGDKTAKPARKNGMTSKANSNSPTEDSTMRNAHDRRETERAHEYDEANEEAGREWSREGESQTTGRSLGTDDEDAEFDLGDRGKGGGSRPRR